MFESSYCSPKTTTVQPEDSAVDCQVFCNQEGYEKLTWNRRYNQCACCDASADVFLTTDEADVYFKGTRNKFDMLLNILLLCR